MKLCRLDLLAFGPFTDVSLCFGSDQSGLHIVYGPNEAGKTSSLRAIRQLLFGIPNLSDDNFLHANQNIRIGAKLENAAGETLECIRRRGRTNTLRGADDIERIDPQVLEEMLGGLDEATFSQRFGIDYEELRQGGRTVVAGGGDLGELLFAAGSGVADLGEVQKQLADEADQLFLTRGTKPQINKALAELKEARRQFKDSQLLTSEWIKHDKALREASERVAAIEKRLLAQTAEKSRLERIHRALPLIAGKQRFQEELAPVSHTPLLPDGFSGSRRESMVQLETAEKTLVDTQHALAKLRQLISELDVPQDLLDHRTAIAHMHTELGSFQKAAKDRPRRVARLEQVEQQAQNILRELGREPDLAQAEELRITRTQRQKIQSLANAFSALQIKAESADSALRQLRDEKRQVESQLAQTAAFRDVGELKRAVQLAQKHGDLDGRRAESQDRLKQLEAQAAIDLKKLRLWQGTLEELEALPIPPLETVERFESSMLDSRAVVQAVQRRIEETTERISRLQQQLESLRLEHDVPTEDDLSAARLRRDAGWQLVLRSWRSAADSNREMADDTESAEFTAEFAAGNDLAQAFQASVEAADQLADRLRREADHVAEKAKLMADHQELTRRLEGLLQEESDAQQAVERLQSSWRDEWAALDIEPTSPREMRSWLGQQAALAEAVAEIRRQRAAVESFDNLIEAQRLLLDQRLTEQSLPPVPQGDSLSAVLGRCEERVTEMETAARTREDLEKSLQKLQINLSRSEQELEQAEQALAGWRADWNAAVGYLGLDQTASPTTVNSVVELVDELFLHIREAEDARHRIKTIDRDADEFTRSVQSLLSKIAADLRDVPVEQAVADLYDRMQAAHTAQTKLEGWNERLQQEQAKLTETEAQALHWRTTLKNLCQEAGGCNVDQLAEAEARSAQRKDLENKLRLLDEQLTDLAGSTPLDQFTAEAGQQDGDQLKATIEHLAGDIEALENDKSEENKTIGGERMELRRMDGSGLAAEAQEKVEHLLARIRGDAEQYVRLRLASSVLRHSIERFREASQGPVLQRASELFRELTLGSFDGLRADYDDKGNAVLVGVRPGGQPIVHTEGMSDGTCDQLYLALRLSLLDTYLAQRGPVPFIVDDILIMFDDERTVAALKALVRLSEKTQVIYFTHHDHIVRLAREHIGDRLSTHTLNQRSVIVA